MAVTALTTDDLTSEVKDLCVLPDADARLGATTAAANIAICKLASRVLRTACADLLVSSRSERLVTDIIVPNGGNSQTIASGTYLYDVPERALAAGVADVLILEVGATTLTEWSAPEVPATDAWRWTNSHGGWDSPYAYCWRDHQLELLPHPTTTQYLLHIWHPRGLMRLVPTASAAKVASKTATSITTVATVPSTWASSETLDIIRASRQGQPRGIDQAGTSISGTSITISAGVPTATTAGDYVCLDGETCVPPVPEVVWPVLVDGTALEVLRVVGDQQSQSDGMVRLRESVASAKNLLTPRSRGASKKIVARGYGTRRGWR